ncbi:MAG TPA: hypothetical protein VMW16_11915 [Sedimentisphaerales bacterium]|nr:hypothetical protein [Sedimentisphaerales bacterium]
MIIQKRAVVNAEDGEERDAGAHQDCGCVFHAGSGFRDHSWSHL